MGGERKKGKVRKVVLCKVIYAVLAGTTNFTRSSRPVVDTRLRKIGHCTSKIMANAMAKRLLPICVVACLVYLAFAQESAKEKTPEINVASLSTQEIEEELQVSIY